MAVPFVFFGSPGICIPALEALEKGGHMPEAVVCQPDRPAGRGRKQKKPEVKCWAEDKGMMVLQPERCSSPEVLRQVEQLRPRFGLVFSFGQLIPRKMLEIPELGFFNIHPSLLPRWRGAAPVQWTLISGDTKTGVTIIKMTPRLDDGDILLQKSTKIDPDEDAERLSARLSEMAAGMMPELFGLLESGRPLPLRPQEPSGVTWAPALKKEDGRLEWQKPAIELHNRVRGTRPWPGAWTTLDGRMLKIHRTRPVDEHTDEPAGRVVRARGDELLVAAGSGLLRVMELQLEGKRRLDARSFLASGKLKAGMSLGT
ncbi:MAG: methionyl-tRNA formyltransferase [Deltaproteobacteria bacterium]|nr:MAG: methionyl-tRNA formyltransferase [Deltaproteobacteria bacterium]